MAGLIKSGLRAVFKKKKEEPVSTPSSASTSAVESTSSPSVSSSSTPSARKNVEATPAATQSQAKVLARPHEEALAWGEIKRVTECTKLWKRVHEEKGVRQAELVAQLAQVVLGVASTVAGGSSSSRDCTKPLTPLDAEGRPVWGPDPTLFSALAAVNNLEKERFSDFYGVFSPMGAASFRRCFGDGRDLAVFLCKLLTGRLRATLQLPASELEFTSLSSESFVSALILLEFLLSEPLQTHKKVYGAPFSNLGGEEVEELCDPAAKISWGVVGVIQQLAVKASQEAPREGAGGERAPAPLQADHFDMLAGAVGAAASVCSAIASSCLASLCVSLISKVHEVQNDLQHTFRKEKKADDFLEEETSEERVSLLFRTGCRALQNSIFPLLFALMRRDGCLRDVVTTGGLKSLEGIALGTFGPDFVQIYTMDVPEALTFETTLLTPPTSPVGEEELCESQPGNAFGFDDDFSDLFQTKKTKKPALEPLATTTQQKGMAYETLYCASVHISQYCVFALLCGVESVAAQKVFQTLFQHFVNAKLLSRALKGLSDHFHAEEAGKGRNSDIIADTETTRMGFLAEVVRFCDTYSMHMSTMLRDPSSSTTQLRDPILYELNSLNEVHYQKQSSPKSKSAPPSVLEPYVQNGVGVLGYAAARAHFIEKGAALTCFTNMAAVVGLEELARFLPGKARGKTPTWLEAAPAGEDLLGSFSSDCFANDSFFERNRAPSVMYASQSSSSTDSMARNVKVLELIPQLALLCKGHESSHLAQQAMLHGLMTILSNHPRNYIMVEKTQIMPRLLADLEKLSGLGQLALLQTLQFLVQQLHIKPLQAICIAASQISNKNTLEKTRATLLKMLSDFVGLESSFNPVLLEANTSHACVLYVANCLLCGREDALSDECTKNMSGAIDLTLLLCKGNTESRLDRRRHSTDAVTNYSFDSPFHQNMSFTSQCSAVENPTSVFSAVALDSEATFLSKSFDNKTTVLDIFLAESVLGNDTARADRVQQFLTEVSGIDARTESAGGLVELLLEKLGTYCTEAGVEYRSLLATLFQIGAVLHCAGPQLPVFCRVLKVRGVQRFTTVLMKITETQPEAGEEAVRTASARLCWMCLWVLAHKCTLCRSQIGFPSALTGHLRGVVGDKVAFFDMMFAATVGGIYVPEGGVDGVVDRILRSKAKHENVAMAEYVALCAKLLSVDNAVCETLFATIPTAARRCKILYQEALSAAVYVMGQQVKGDDETTFALTRSIVSYLLQTTGPAVPLIAQGDADAAECALSIITDEWERAIKAGCVSSPILEGFAPQALSSWCPSNHLASVARLFRKPSNEDIMKNLALSSSILSKACVHPYGIAGNRSYVTFAGKTASSKISFAADIFPTPATGLCVSTYFKFSKPQSILGCGPVLFKLTWKNGRTQAENTCSLGVDRKGELVLVSDCYTKQEMAALLETEGVRPSRGCAAVPVGFGEMLLEENVEYHVMLTHTPVKVSPSFKDVRTLVHKIGKNFGGATLQAQSSASSSSLKVGKSALSRSPSINSEEPGQNSNNSSQQSSPASVASPFIVNVYVNGQKLKKSIPMAYPVIDRDMGPPVWLSCGYGSPRLAKCFAANNVTDREAGTFSMSQLRLATAPPPASERAAALLLYSLGSSFDRSPDAFSTTMFSPFCLTGPETASLTETQLKFTSKLCELSELAASQGTPTPFESSPLRGPYISFKMADTVLIQPSESGKNCCTVRGRTGGGVGELVSCGGVFKETWCGGGGSVVESFAKRNAAGLLLGWVTEGAALGLRGATQAEVKSTVIAVLSLVRVVSPTDQLVAGDFTLPLAVSQLLLANPAIFDVDVANAILSAAISERYRLIQNIPVLNYLILNPSLFCLDEGVVCKLLKGVRDIVGFGDEMPGGVSIGRFNACRMQRAGDAVRGLLLAFVGASHEPNYIIARRPETRPADQPDTKHSPLHVLQDFFKNAPPLSVLLEATATLKQYLQALTGETETQAEAMKEVMVFIEYLTVQTTRVNVAQLATLDVYLNASSAQMTGTEVFDMYYADPISQATVDHGGSGGDGVESEVICHLPAGHIQLAQNLLLKVLYEFLFDSEQHNSSSPDRKNTVSRALQTFQGLANPGFFADILDTSQHPTTTTLAIKLLVLYLRGPTFPYSAAEERDPSEGHSFPWNNRIEALRASSGLREVMSKGVCRFWSQYDVVLALLCGACDLGAWRWVRGSSKGSLGDCIAELSMLASVVSEQFQEKEMKANEVIALLGSKLASIDQKFRANLHRESDNYMLPFNHDGTGLFTIFCPMLLDVVAQGARFVEEKRFAGNLGSLPTQTSEVLGSPTDTTGQAGQTGTHLTLPEPSFFTQSVTVAEYFHNLETRGAKKGSAAQQRWHRVVYKKLIPLIRTKNTVFGRFLDLEMTPTSLQTLKCVMGRSFTAPGVLVEGFNEDLTLQHIDTDVTKRICEVCLQVLGICIGGPAIHQGAPPHASTAPASGALPSPKRVAGARHVTSLFAFLSFHTYGSSVERSFNAHHTTDYGDGSTLADSASAAPLFSDFRIEAKSLSLLYALTDGLLHEHTDATHAPCGRRHSEALFPSCRREADYGGAPQNQSLHQPLMRGSEDVDQLLSTGVDRLDTDDFVCIGEGDDAGDDSDDEMEEVGAEGELLFEGNDKSSEKRRSWFLSTSVPIWDSSFAASKPFFDATFELICKPIVCSLYSDSPWTALKYSGKKSSRSSERRPPIVRIIHQMLSLPIEFEETRRSARSRRKRRKAKAGITENDFSFAFQLTVIKRVVGGLEGEVTAIVRNTAAMNAFIELFSYLVTRLHAGLPTPVPELLVTASDILYQLESRSLPIPRQLWSGFYNRLHQWLLAPVGYPQGFSVDAALNTLLASLHTVFHKSNVDGVYVGCTVYLLHCLLCECDVGTSGGVVREAFAAQDVSVVREKVLVVLRLVTSYAQHAPLILHEVFVASKKNYLNGGFDLLDGTTSGTESFGYWERQTRQDLKVYFAKYHLKNLEKTLVKERKNKVWLQQTVQRSRADGVSCHYAQVTKRSTFFSLCERRVRKNSLSEPAPAISSPLANVAPFTVYNGDVFVPRVFSLPCGVGSLLRSHGVVVLPDAALTGGNVEWPKRVSGNFGPLLSATAECAKRKKSDEKADNSSLTPETPSLDANLTPSGAPAETTKCDEKTLRKEHAQYRISHVASSDARLVPVRTLFKHHRGGVPMKGDEGVGLFSGVVARLAQNYAQGDSGGASSGGGAGNTSPKRAEKAHSQGHLAGFQPQPHKALGDVSAACHTFVTSFFPSVTALPMYHHLLAENMSHVRLSPVALHFFARVLNGTQSSMFGTGSCVESAGEANVSSPQGIGRNIKNFVMSEDTYAGVGVSEQGRAATATTFATHTPCQPFMFFNIVKMYLLESVPSVLLISSQNVCIVSHCQVDTEGKVLFQPANHRRRGKGAPEEMKRGKKESYASDSATSVFASALSSKLSNFMWKDKGAGRESAFNFANADSGNKSDGEASFLKRFILSKTFVHLWDESCVSELPLTSVLEVLKKNVHHEPVAIELTSESQPNILFTVLNTHGVISEKEREKLFGVLAEASPYAASPHANCTLSDITNLWKNNLITNFDYLQAINGAAGRNFSDLNQYPVFPWVLNCYEGTELFLQRPESYRDLSKPMGAIEPKRSEAFTERYADWSEEDTSVPKFHYGSHYSTPMMVLWYLTRLQPLTSMAVVYQGGKLDLADRLFHSVADAWHSSSKGSNTDVKELTPEFFFNPEFLLNGNSLLLGENRHGEELGNIVLPKWAVDADAFIFIQRRALESSFVSEKIHLWIDLIFGVGQTGIEAKRRVNVFFHLTYPGGLQRLLDSTDDIGERWAAATQVAQFGQTPKQLFAGSHPMRAKGPLTSSVSRLLNISRTAACSRFSGGVTVTSARYGANLSTGRSTMLWINDLSSQENGTALMLASSGIAMLGHGQGYVDLSRRDGWARIFAAGDGACISTVQLPCGARGGCVVGCLPLAQILFIGTDNGVLACKLVATSIPPAPYRRWIESRCPKYYSLLPVYRLVSQWSPVDIVIVIPNTTLMLTSSNEGTCPTVWHIAPNQGKCAGLLKSHKGLLIDAKVLHSRRYVYLFICCTPFFSPFFLQVAVDVLV